MRKEQGETTLHNVLAKRKENIASSCPFPSMAEEEKKKRKGCCYSLSIPTEREREEGGEWKGCQPTDASACMCVSLPLSLSLSLDYYRIPIDDTGNV